MRRFLHSLLRLLRAWRPGQPLISIEISKSALLKNISALQSLAPEWGVAPVLKSNAYGHELALVADAMKNAKEIPFFCVDSYFEARTLCALGVKKPLLVLGHTQTEVIRSSNLASVLFTVASLGQLQELAASGASRRVHIKFDTGMHRRGILRSDLSTVFELLKAGSNLSVEGVLSHLAESETAGSALTKKQIGEWNEIARAFQKEFPAIKHYHLANSGGFAYAKDIVANVGRSGLAFYGINPGNLSVRLMPALKMRTTVCEISTVHAGDSIGYNATFTAKRGMRVAMVPAGYFEGVDRRLSNAGSFLVAGKPAPIVGRVSMNMSSCDVTDIPEAAPGSPVVLISDNPADPNSVEAMAKLAGIPYEILVHIPVHLHRALVS